MLRSQQKSALAGRRATQLDPVEAIRGWAGGQPRSPACRHPQVLRQRRDTANRSTSKKSMLNGVLFCFLGAASTGKSSKPCKCRP